jgi:hypothetical protein
MSPRNQRLQSGSPSPFSRIAALLLLATIPLVALSGSLAGCGGGGSSSPGPSASPTPTPGTAVGQVINNLLPNSTSISKAVASEGIETYQGIPTRPFNVVLNGSGFVPRTEYTLRIAEVAGTPADVSSVYTNGGGLDTTGLVGTWHFPMSEMPAPGQTKTFTLVFRDSSGAIVSPKNADTLKFTLTVEP